MAKARIEAHQRAVVVSPTAGPMGMCMADRWRVQQDVFNGEFDLDEPIGQEILRRLLAQQPGVVDTLRSWDSSPAAAAPARSAGRPEDDLPPWVREYVFGEWGGKGVASESWSAAIGPGNVMGNALAAAQAGHYASAQSGTAARLRSAAQKVSGGGARSVRINDFMELYNANQGKGRPRLRLRVKGLPLHTVSPSVPTAQWRPNGPGTAHSTRWATPTAQQIRGAAGLAAETRWDRAMGWSGTRVGTGLITFAPTLAMDAWGSIQFDLDSAGNRRMSGFNRDDFVIRSARNQSGNAVGLLLSAGAAIALTGVVAAGAPLILVSLGVGLVAQVAWVQLGGADLAERGARQALGISR